MPIGWLGAGHVTRAPAVATKGIVRMSCLTSLPTGGGPLEFPLLSLSKFIRTRVPATAPSRAPNQGAVL